MEIVFVTSESLPFSKTGGLADVVYGLGKSLVKSGEKVTIITPLYKGIDKSSLTSLVKLPVKMSWRNEVAKLSTTSIDGIKFIFVDHPFYYDREELYGYDDDIERFAFLNLTFIEMIKRMNFRPDIIHIHDWETAMIPLLLKENNIPIKTVLTIHNPAFQGNTHPSNLGNYFNLDESYFHQGLCRFHDYFSMLKTGLVTADLITTVSVTHAKELLKDKISYNELGHIIELRKCDFIGITNGVDVEEFDPSSDRFLEATYDYSSFEEGKKINRDYLIKTLMKSQTNSGPVYGIVSRLTDQKGLSDLKKIFPLLKKQKAQLVVIGSGQKDLESFFSDYSLSHPENLVYYCGYSSLHAHLTYASIDFFLMPSKFEPCGIGQMIAKRYGSIPIVSNVGGLFDTVIPYNGKNQKTAEGIRFDIEKPRALENALIEAEKIFKDKTLYKQLIANCFKAKSSWDDITPKYLAQYQILLAKK